MNRCIDRAYALLIMVGQVDRPSDFGHLLIERGIVKPVSPQKRHTRQGLALLGGLWLSKLRKAGLAEYRWRGKGLPHAVVPAQIDRLVRE